MLAVAASKLAEAQMSSVPHSWRVVGALELAAVLAVTPGCGGSGGADAPPEIQPTATGPSILQGRQVADRAEALQIVERGIMAPLLVSEAARALLSCAFEHAMPDPTIGIDIEAADNPQGLLVRGEAGSVRAVLRFDGAALGVGAPVDGTITLDVSRPAAGTASVWHSRADTLSVSQRGRTLSWSYLYTEVEEGQGLKALNVVSDLPIDASQSVAIDVTLTASADGVGAQHYVAAGILSSLDADLALDVTADGRWTIGVDNARDGRIDFIAQAAAPQARDFSCTAVRATR
jgi:hypothetical protein